MLNIQSYEQFISNVPNNDIKSGVRRIVHIPIPGKPGRPKPGYNPQKPKPKPSPKTPMFKDEELELM